MSNSLGKCQLAALLRQSPHHYYNVLSQTVAPDVGPCVWLSSVLERGAALYMVVVTLFSHPLPRPHLLLRSLCPRSLRPWGFASSYLVRGGTRPD